MADDDQLNHLIGMLYETVVNPDLWQEVIGLCGRYAGGIDAQFFTIDKRHNTLTAAVLAETAFPSEGGIEYTDYYVNIDPRQKSMQTAGLNQWICCHHSYDQFFFDHNEFCQDFLVRYGCRYVMGAWVDDSETHRSQLIALRAVGQKPFERADQLAAQRFSGHLQRALRLQAHTQNLQNKAELGAMAIDALALCMLIVDANRRILHLNREAERLLASAAFGLGGNGGRLSLNDSIDRNRLSALIAGATAFPAVGGAMILRSDASLQLFVTPLPAASALVRDWQRPLALVWVMETGKVLPQLELIGKLYDLSPAELRVASALLAGRTPEEYAQDTGVTINTVRTQLRSLFNKTGTRRQSELVAVLSRVPPMRNGM